MKVVDPAQTKNLLVSTMRPLAVIIQAPFFCVIRHHCVSAEGGGGDRGWGEERKGARERGRNDAEDVRCHKSIGRFKRTCFLCVHLHLNTCKRACPYMKCTHAHRNVNIKVWRGLHLCYSVFSEFRKNCWKSIRTLVYFVLFCTRNCILTGFFSHARPLCVVCTCICILSMQAASAPTGQGIEE